MSVKGGRRESRKRKKEGINSLRTSAQSVLGPGSASILGGVGKLELGGRKAGEGVLAHHLLARDTQSHRGGGENKHRKSLITQDIKPKARGVSLSSTQEDTIVSDYRGGGSKEATRRGTSSKKCCEDSSSGDGIGGGGGAARDVIIGKGHLPFSSLSHPNRGRTINPRWGPRLRRAGRILEKKNGTSIIAEGKVRLMIERKLREALTQPGRAKLEGKGQRESFSIRDSRCRRGGVGDPERSKAGWRP